VKLNSDLREALEASTTTTKASKNHKIDDVHRHSMRKSFEAPRHDLKIIIAKKSSSKIRLNKPNGNSKVLSDFERLRGDVDNVQQQFSSASSSESFVSTSEMKTTLSKKTGTVSHHDLKLENKSSNTKKQQHNSSNDSHDYYYESTTMNEREKEKCYSSLEKQQKRESTKHAKNNEKVKKSNLSSNIPKLKIELPSLKAKITVPKTSSDTYVITPKTPLTSPKCSPRTPLKKVRFDMSSSFDFNDDDAVDINSVDQMEYAERIGLKPVERKVESIILHRKRKKSKHSKESEHSKRPKLHVSSSLDESLKLKLKIMGGKSCKSDKSEATCNLRGKEEKQKKYSDDAVVGLENYKYSVSEQKNAKSGGDQPMVFIPKLVLQKTQNTSSSSSDKKESYSGVDATTAQRRNSFVVEQSNPTSLDANECIKLKVKSFDAIASSNLANQKLMKPPTAKMGSPKQSHISTAFSPSPIRPHSIPASLKLSPISQSPPSTSGRNDFQNMKRSLSLGAEKLPHFPMDIQYSKIPPLIPTSSPSRNFYGSMHNKSQSPQHASKLPNINVKDPIKLFPNACSSVEILKIPQKTFFPPGNIKLNRPMPTTIPLERIRKSAQCPVSPKILPRPQNVMKAPSFQSPQCSSQTNLNYSGIYQTPPINQDISLERYTLELTHDIAKLDRSLSLEKNFEDWEKRKLQEYNVKRVQNLLSQQQNLSVRNVPNPSAIMMSRNQTSGFKTTPSIKVASFSPQKETVTSTNSEHSDIEDILSKSTIAKANEKQLFDLSSSQKSPGSRVNDKKSIEKLTEYLRITASKSKDMKHDEDNNNNNSTNNIDESSANGRNFNLMANKSEKFMNVNLPSVDVICIDS
jgi:hypothetical protein